jgi:hypothetical protein
MGQHKLTRRSDVLIVTQTPGEITLLLWCQHRQAIVF